MSGSSNGSIASADVNAVVEDNGTSDSAVFKQLQQQKSPRRRKRKIGFRVRKPPPLVGLPVLTACEPRRHDLVESISTSCATGCGRLSSSRPNRPAARGLRHCAVGEKHPGARHQGPTQGSASGTPTRMAAQLTANPRTGHL